MPAVRKTGGTVEFVDSGKNEGTLTAEEEAKIESAYGLARQRKKRNKILLVAVFAAVIVVAAWLLLWLF